MKKKSYRKSSFNKRLASLRPLILQNDGFMGVSKNQKPPEMLIKILGGGGIAAVRHCYKANQNV